MKVRTGLRSGLRLVDEDGPRPVLAEAARLRELGTTLAATAALDEAEEVLLDALCLQHHQEARRDEGYTRVQLAVVESHRGEVGEARGHLVEALKIAVAEHDEELRRAVFAALDVEPLPAAA